MNKEVPVTVNVGGMVDMPATGKRQEVVLLPGRYMLTYVGHDEQRRYRHPDQTVTEKTLAKTLDSLVLLPGHPNLVKARRLLVEAQTLISDWVDGLCEPPRDALAEAAELRKLRERVGGSFMALSGKGKSEP